MRTPIGLLAFSCATWLFASCFRAESNTCADVVCPKGWECVELAQPEADVRAAFCINPLDTLCGNGVVDPNEECDDANYRNDDECNWNCLFPKCGDGYRRTDLGEVCDDGNKGPGDGCSATCDSREICGDGIINTVTGEACDSGSFCADLTTACQSEADCAALEDTSCGPRDVNCCTAECKNPFCGNNVVERECAEIHTDRILEVCDFGSQCENGQPCKRDTDCGDIGDKRCRARDNPNCSQTCLFANPCGDGIANRAFGEVCDGGRFCSDLTDCVTDADCAGKPGDELCLPRNTLRCTADCRSEGICGDKIPNTQEPYLEVCDDGKHCENGVECTTNSDCPVGECITRGDDGCSADCKAIGKCGNGETEVGEACDDGNRLDGDGCSADCRNRCGDGVQHAQEECDDGEDCADGTCNGETRACLADCKDARCGDRLVQSGVEQCDSGALDSATCDNDCSSATCGDNYRNAAASEDCDSGKVNTIDCNENCRYPKCGDNIINRPAGERCDDGNRDDLDGCSRDCTSTEECGDTVTNPRVGEVCDNGSTCDSGATCEQDSDCPSGELCTPKSGGGCSKDCRSTEVCGDGYVNFDLLEAAEACDDFNTDAGDGCGSRCQVELGWACQPRGAAPTSTSRCSVVCGDGIVVAGSETCDDGDTSSGDGCSPRCQAEVGWACPTAGGTGGECTPVCGDGLVKGNEPCDDGDTTGGDGCSNTCTVEAGWSCPPQLSGRCQPVCGDGLVRLPETCDDGDVASLDGCSAACQTELGWTCTTPGSECAPVCGDGFVRGVEGCDDGGTAAGDGCSTTCTAEAGWECPASLNGRCRTLCGDGLVRGTEDCDDANKLAGDGCNATCQREAGWTCATAGPCTADCGDGLVRGVELCDDANRLAGDGCNTTCQRESGWSCPQSTTGAPLGGSCQEVCGDGQVVGGETCDDRNAIGADGCDSGCKVEQGWACAVAGTACTPICGDGQVRGIETCDEGTRPQSGGCEFCKKLDGWYCIPGQTCTTECGDGTQAGGEECDDGVNNDNTADCTSGCTIATCDDGFLHAAGTAPYETDIDCGGGDCVKCAENSDCAVRDDCETNFCDPNTLRCEIPTRRDDSFTMQVTEGDLTIAFVDLFANDDDDFPTTFSVVQGACGLATVVGTSVVFDPELGTPPCTAPTLANTPYTATFDYQVCSPDFPALCSDATVTVVINRAPRLDLEPVCVPTGTASASVSVLGGYSDPDGNSLDVSKLGSPGFVTVATGPGIAEVSGSTVTFKPDDINASAEYIVGIVACDSIAAPEQDESLCTDDNVASDQTWTVRWQTQPSLAEIADADALSTFVSQFPASPSSVPVPYYGAGNRTVLASGSTPSDVQVEIAGTIVGPYYGDLSTTVADDSDNDGLPVSEISVTSTAGFPDSGAILVATSAGPQIVTYTGKSAVPAKFTGASGGTGDITPDSTVRLAVKTLQDGYCVVNPDPSGDGSTTYDGQVTYTTRSAVGVDSCYARVCQTCVGSTLCSTTRVPFDAIARPTADDDVVAAVAQVGGGAAGSFAQSTLLDGDQNVASTITLLGYCEDNTKRCAAASECTGIGGGTCSASTDTGKTECGGTVTLAGANINYTFAGTCAGNDSFGYRVCSLDAAVWQGAGAPTRCVDANVDVIINALPVADDDTVATDEDTPGVFSASTLLTGDTDSDVGDTLVVYSVQNPTNGTVGLVGTTITFTPNTHFNSGVGTATFQYTVYDGRGGYDDATVTVTVNPINDAPVLDNTKAPTLTAQAEDCGLAVCPNKPDNSSYGTLVFDLVDLKTPVGGLDNITEYDSTPLMGIAIIGRTVANGSWWYTINGGNAANDWSQLNAVSDNNALHLYADADTRIFFRPNKDFTGTATITFRAWDQTNVDTEPGPTQLEEGDYADIDSTGGITAYSSSTDTALASVGAFDDPPTASDDAITTNEDVAKVLALTDFGTYTDPEGTEPLAAIKITGLPTNGKLQFDDEGTGDWTGDDVVAANGFYTVTQITDGQLRFVPDPNEWASSAYATALFRVSESASDDGLSTSDYTLTINVAGVNDAPIGTSNDTASVLEDGVYTFSSAVFGFSDPNDAQVLPGIPGPANDFQAVVLTTVPTTHGILKFGVNAATVGQVIAFADIPNLTFVPNANVNSAELGDDLGSFTFQVRDNGGTTNGGVNTDSARSFNFEITAVNDEPVVASGTVQNLTVLEDTSATSLALGSVTWAPGPSNESAQTLTYEVTAVPSASLGTVQTAVNATVNVGRTGSISELQGMKFLPAANASGGPEAFSWRIIDNGGTLNSGDDSLAQSLTITVTAVNDVPTRTAGTVASQTKLEDAATFSLNLTTLAYSPGPTTPVSEASQTLTYTITGVPAPTLGDVVLTDGTSVVSVNSSYTLTQLQGMKFRPTANGNGTGTFSWSVVDNGGTANSGQNTLNESLDVTLTPVNDEPVRTAGTVANLTVAEDTQGTSLGLTAVTYSGGPSGANEDGQTLTYTVTDVPPSSLGNVVKADGTTVVNVSNTLTLAELRGLKFNATLNANGGPEAFSWTVSDDGGTADGGDNSLSQSLNITVTPGNDNPTFANLAGDVLVYNGTAAADLEQGNDVTVTDGDSLNFNGGSLTVQILEPNFNDLGTDTISIVDGSGYTVNGTNLKVGSPIVASTEWDTVTGTFTVLFINDLVTPALVADIVKNLRFSNTVTNIGADRTVRFVLDDGDGATSGNVDMQIQDRNDQPTLTATALSPTYTENDALTPVSVFSTDATPSTIEVGQTLTRIDLTISNLSDGAADRLHIDGSIFALNGAGGTTTNNGMSCVITRPGDPTPPTPYTAIVQCTKAAPALSGGQMDTLIEGIGYSSNTQDPTDANHVFTITRLDDSGRTSLDNGLHDNSNTSALPAASTVNVDPLNDQPTLTASGTNPTFNEGDIAIDLYSGTPTPIVANAIENGQKFKVLGLTVSNIVDSAGSFEKFTFNSTEFNLVAAAAGTATGSGVTREVLVASNTATITFTATTAVDAAALQGLIDAMKYRHSGQAPTAGTRVVTITRLDDDGLTSGSNDASNTGLAIVSNVNVVALNDAPTNTVPGSQTTAEDTAKVFSSGNSNVVSVADLDVGAGSVQVGLVVTNGTMTLSGTTGLSFTLGDGTADASMTFTGSLTDVNTAMNGMSYNPTADYAGSAQLTVNTSDQGNTGTGGTLTDSDNVAITVDAVNDTPVANITVASYTAAEKTNLNLHGTLVVSDVDSAASNVTVTLTTIEGTITVSVGTNSTVTPSGSGTASVTLTGPVAAVANVLAGSNGATVVYFNNSNSPSATETLTLSINDNGNTGSGGAKSASEVVNIDFTEANDAPTASITPTSYNATEQVALTLNGTGLAVDDVDAGNAVVKVTVSVPSGEGIISVGVGTSGVTLVGAINNAASVSFTGTLTEVNRVLTGANSATLSYTANINAPPATTTLTLAIDDQGNTGSGGAKTASDTATINIAGTNDGPTATITTDPYSATEQTNLNLHGTGMSVSDPDAASDDVIVTLKVIDGVLTVDEGATGVIVNDTDPKSIVLNGTLTEINDLLAGAAGGTIVYLNTSDNPDATDTVTLEISDNGKNGSGGALLHSDSSTINVTAVDDAPTAVNDTPADLLEDAGATAIDVLTNDTDPDGGTKSIASTTNGTNGTVVITGGGIGLTYLPNANYCGADSFTYTLNGGSIGTVNVTVTCVNDAPSFAKGADLSVDNADGNGADRTYTVPGWATGMSVGPANESGQTFDLEIVSNSNAAIFATGGEPAVDDNGQLTFTTESSATGSSTIGIRMRDSGGTLNGGVRDSATQSFVITTAVNALPTITDVMTSISYVGPGAEVIDSAITINDVDTSDMIVSATIKITLGHVQAEDTLAFTDSGTDNITGAYNDATGEITLSGLDTRENYELVLESVTFLSTAATSDREVTWSVNDGTNNSAGVVTHICISTCE